MKPQHLFISAIILFLLSGCLSQRKATTKYYLIEMPDSLEFSVREKKPYLNGYCNISTVQVPPAFNTQKIAVRSNTHEIKYYSYHFWAQRTDETLTMTLEDYFLRSSVFEGISTRYLSTPPDYKIVTNVYQIEIVEQGEEISAHLSLEFRLTDTKENKLLLVHKVDRNKLLLNKDLNLFAGAISDLLYEELNIFSERIIQSIDKNGKDKQLNDNEE